MRKLEDKFQRIELYHVPRKDNDAANFLAKLAAKRDLSPSGIFINNLHEPSARVLEGSIQAHPDAKPMPRGFDPDAKPMLGGSDPSASMTTSLYWHSIEPTSKCCYSPTSSRRFSHPKGLKLDRSLDAPRRSSPSVMNSKSEVHRGYS